MRWSNHFDRNGLNRPELDPREHNVAVLLEGALAFAVCFLFASFAPRELVVASLSSFLFIAAFFSAATAQLRREPVMADRLTNWDVAAKFVLLSIALSWVVDPEAIRAYLEAHGDTLSRRPS